MKFSTLSQPSTMREIVTCFPYFSRNVMKLISLGFSLIVDMSHRCGIFITGMTFLFKLQRNY